MMEVRRAKIEVLIQYVEEREKYKDLDGCLLKLDHEEHMAFLNGWDAAVKFVSGG